MKINKQKHGKENTVGKIIYGFLMFMPLMAIAVTCAYVIFNKNAYQSYYGDTINEEQYENVNLVTDFKVNEKYSVVGNLDNLGTIYESSSRIWVNELTIDNTTYQNVNFAFYSENSTNRRIYIRDNDLNPIMDFLWNTKQFSFTYNRTILTQNNYDIVKSGFYKIEYNNLSFASEVFYYSIDKVEQSPLFSWATNTGTHNVLESTCQTLGITTPFVPMLLAYWLMTSLMYLLYDIALLVVHMAHNRIHDIESSI